LFEKKRMKDMEMHETTSYMDSPCHAISNSRWYATWFLMVEDICPLEYGKPQSMVKKPLNNCNKK
jgi:hypothetical protein